MMNGEECNFMKKSFRKILSFILCICMCVTLLPVLPAAAQTGDSVADPTGYLTNVDELQTNEKYADFSGAVLTYNEPDETTGLIRIDVGYYKVNDFVNTKLNFRYDPEKVTLVDGNGTAVSYNAFTTSYTAAPITGAPIPDSILTSGTEYSGKEMFASDPDKKTMVGAWGPLTYENADFGFKSDSATTKGEMIISVDTIDNPTFAGLFNNMPLRDVESTNIYLFQPYTTTEVMDIYSMYFEPADGATIDYNTFAVYKNSFAPNGFWTTTDMDLESENFVYVNFPKKQETEYKVTFKATGKNSEGTDVELSGGKVTVTGTTAEKNAFSREYTLGTQSTIPYSDSTGYTITVGQSTDADGNLYKMKGTWSIPVTSGGDSTDGITLTYSDMELVPNAFPIKVKAFDPAGAAVDLTGATVKFGTDPVTDTNSETNVVEFTTARSSNLELEISGVDGYQNVTGSSVIITVTPEQDSTTKAELSKHNSSTGKNAAAEVVTEADGSQYIKLNLKLAETTLVVPIDVEGTGLTVAQAEGIAVTMVPAADSSAALKAQVGSGLTFSGSDAISVTADATDSTLAGSVTASVTVPDGSYTMKISGANINPVTTTVTVATNYETTPPTRTVTVGDKTATGDDAEDAEGKGTVDLTDVDFGTTLTPTVVTNPLYDVRITPNLVSGVYETFTVEVYLMNAEASGGSFGMYVDPAVFGTIEAGDIDLADGLDYSDAMYQHSVANPEVDNAETVTGNSYISFIWTVLEEGEMVNGNVDGGALIATITLDSQKMNEEALKAVIDDRSIYTMDYARTGNAALIQSKVNADDYKYQLSAIWRNIDWSKDDIIEDGVHLDKSLATRGGFYQIYAPNTDGIEVPHDIQMKINVPDIVELTRVDFWVTDPTTGKGIENAKVDIYGADYDPDADPAASTLYDDTTDAEGYVFFKVNTKLNGDTYRYVVNESSYWPYPDGTANTVQDHDYDSFRIVETGVEMLLPVYTDPDTNTDTTTPVVGDYINPRMEPMTFHEVALEVTDDGTAPTVSATISGPDAHNGVRYYFTIEPDAGYEWDVDTSDAAAFDTFMTTVATKITGTRYDVDKEASSVTAAFRAGTGASVTVKWEAASDRFYIEADDITGEHIGVTSIGGTDVKPLRAGDIVLNLTTDEYFKAADYIITAIAGVGGTVDIADSADITDPTDGSTILSEITEESSSKIVEKLSNGHTTSREFTFKPDSADYVIHEVIINGVTQALTSAQKTEFKYTFTNVTDDQTIYVSFAEAPDEDGPGEPVSKPFVEVVVGPNGKADVTDGTNDLDPAEVSNGSASYVLDGDTIVITPTADPGYVIDTIKVDGIDTALVDSKITLSGLAEGDSKTVAITFKPEGEESTHVIVTAWVEDGSGTLSPVGINIYPIDSTPVFTMTPASGWTINTAGGAVKVNNVDKSSDVLQKTSDSGDVIFTYQLPALKNDVDLAVTFTEKAYMVVGKIRISVDAKTSGVAPATLTFVRDSDGEEIEIPSGNIPVAGNGCKLLDFTANIPEGTWTVTVEKQGYLDYIITGFEVAKITQDVDSANGIGVIYFGDAACKGGTVVGSADNIKPIPLVIGDAAGDGRSIAQNDAAVVVAGWLDPTKATQANMRMGDVNENLYTTGIRTQGSDTDDMSAVQLNMFTSRSTIVYDIPDDQHSSDPAVIDDFCDLPQ